MRTNIYVDAFNLYYGCLLGTPYKWLDLFAFSRASFPSHSINKIRCFTARVTARPDDPDQPIRQETYFRALRTLPNLEIKEGYYLEKPTWMPIEPPPESGPRTVRVLKSEEKGSDVNLATYLLVDAFDQDYEAAVVISNDSDLVEPIRLVRSKFKRRVFVLHPCTRPGRTPSKALKRAAAVRGGKESLIVRESLLAAHQFPPTLVDAAGTFHKPPGW